MVKPVQRAEIKALDGGLNTEASPLEYPANCTRSEINFDLLPDGSRKKRFGINIESLSVAVPTAYNASVYENLAVNSFKWSSVAGDANKEFLVVQVGQQLFFFNPGAPALMEAPYKTLTIASTSTLQKFGFTAVEGMLVVTAGMPELFIISYDSVVDTLSQTTSRIQIRDLFGLEETTFPYYETNNLKRGGLSYEHYYNLYNQGWGIPRYKTEWLSTALYDPVLLAGWNSGTNLGAPSNADTVWLGMDFFTFAKDVDGNAQTKEGFRVEQMIAATAGTEPAAKGFFVIDAFDRGASRVTKWNELISSVGTVGALLSPAVFTAPDDETPGGPTVITTYAGRVFYSGCKGAVVDGDKRSPDFSNFIFFSKLVENSSDITKCYQVGDPTSRESADIVATDGGFIKIAEAYDIKALVPMGGRLFVLAANGVWSISGGSDYGFTATNYKVDKLSDKGVLSSDSVVVVDNKTFFWSQKAIYLIAPSQYGDWTVSDVTFSRIKSIYLTISDKPGARGTYDPYADQVIWTYGGSGEFANTGKTTYELIYDIKHDAFITNTITISPNPAKPFLATALSLAVHQTRKSLGFKKNVGTGNLEIIFAEYTNTDFKDWGTLAGASNDVTAFLITGEHTMKDVAVSKQISYLTTVFKNTELSIVGELIDTESSCKGMVRWDFSDSKASNRWSREMELYRRPRFRYGDAVYSGHTYLTTKSKLRGHGQAFALQFTAAPLKACHIIGWNIQITGNGVA